MQVARPKGQLPAAQLGGGALGAGRAGDAGAGREGHECDVLAVVAGLVPHGGDGALWAGGVSGVEVDGERVALVAVAAAGLVGVIPRTGVTSRTWCWVR